jgi:hypothetical protein
VRRVGNFGFGGSEWAWAASLLIALVVLTRLVLWVLPVVRADPQTAHIIFQDNDIII